MCGDKVPTILFSEYPWAHIGWLAVANSFAMDFLSRKKVSLKMSYTVVDSLPFPRFEKDEPILRELISRVLKLVCAAPELLPFWNEMAEDEWVPPHTIFASVPGTTGETERRTLQAEIDAIVAKEVYGLTREELAHVLDTFPIVKKRDTKEFGDFRTKLRVLRAYDELVSGEPTQTTPAKDA